MCAVLLLSLILGIRSEALEDEKEKLVSLEIVRGYLCHLDLKHISRITEFHLPFPFLIIKGRYYTLSNNLKLLSSWNS